MTGADSRLRVTVVGAGIMGLSTAWALARRGHRVSVFEQHPIPNPLGSSVDQHRLIRHAYGAEAGYTRMVDAAYAAWDRLWRDLGETLHVPTGTLALDSGSGRNAWLHDSARTLAALGREVRWLSRRELEREFPLVRAEDVTDAFFLDTGGVLLAGRIVELMAHRLPSERVTVHPRTPVAEVDPESGRVVLADRRTVEADRVVVAAGPWVSRLLPALAGRVTPSRQVVAYLTPPDDLAAAWGRAPMLLDIEPESGFYLVPPVRGTGLKIGDHSFSLRGDPERDRDAGIEETRAVFEKGRRRLRDFDRYGMAAGRTCFYTVQPKERFVVEPVGTKGWVMTGFSGHGFKFGALMGERMAEALEDPGAAGRITRWAAGDPDRP